MVSAEKNPAVVMDIGTGYTKLGTPLKWPCAWTNVVGTSSFHCRLPYSKPSRHARGSMQHPRLKHQVKHQQHCCH